MIGVVMGLLIALSPADDRLDDYARDNRVMVCYLLDKHSGLATQQELATRMTDSDALAVMRWAVENYCPRNRATLEGLTS